MTKTHDNECEYHGGIVTQENAERCSRCRTLYTLAMDALLTVQTESEQRYAERLLREHGATDAPCNLCHRVIDDWKTAVVDSEWGRCHARCVDNISTVGS